MNGRHGTSIATFFLMCILVSTVAAQEKVAIPEAIAAYPDLILYNGKVVTMDDTSMGPSPGRIFESIAIRDRKVQALGTSAEILSYAGPKTGKIDLKGRTVMPGIVDTHTHIHNGAVDQWANENPELFSDLARKFSVTGNTFEELRRGIELVLKEQMSGAPPDQWAFIDLPQYAANDPAMPGIGIKFLQGREITLKDLDKLTKHPVHLVAFPSRIINTAAKKQFEKIMGFFPEEIIDEHGFGQLTALFRSLPVDSYFAKRPNAAEELADIVEKGMLGNAAVGITTYVSHITGLQFFDAFRLLERQDRMPIRFGYSHYYGFEVTPEPEVFYRGFGDMAGLGSDYFWNVGTGLSAVDGNYPQMCTSLDVPSNKEICRNKPDVSSRAKVTLVALERRQRVAVGHIYGDKALEYFLDQVDAAMQQDPTLTLEQIRSKRLSSDHCGFYPRPDQIPRMARIGMIISCAGNRITSSYPALKEAGMQYANWIAPAKSMLKAGVKVTAENEAGPRRNRASSYFYETFAFITRKNEQGVLIAPEEAVDRVTLIKMMTAWGAEFALREKFVGTLEPGKFADLLVLNKDYFTVPEPEIPSIFPLLTMVGGKIQVLRNEFAQELGRNPVGPQLEFRNMARNAQQLETAQ